MDQYINYKDYKKRKHGVTLIELVIYMGIFTLLVSGFLYTALYIQNILSHNTTEYKTQEQIYTQLNLLQHHLNSATDVELSSTSIKITNPYGYTKQYFQDNLLYMTYVYSFRSTLRIVPYPITQFTKFSFTQQPQHETLSANSIIWVDIERVDTRGKKKSLRTYLVQYRNPAP